MRAAVGGAATGEPVVVAQELKHSYDGKKFALDGLSFSALWRKNGA